MKTIFLSSLFLILSFGGFAQVSKNGAAKPDANKKVVLVEASCGECNFGMQGKSCELAIRMNGKVYFVDGATIQDFGSPHDKGGFCVAVRKAEVQGEVVNGRFKASYFKLLKPGETASK